MREFRLKSENGRRRLSNSFPGGRLGVNAAILKLGRLVSGKVAV